MPFTNCRRCGRLFHTYEPLMPEKTEGYWRDASGGDAAYELCPECLNTLGPLQGSSTLIAAEPPADDAPH